MLERGALGGRRHTSEDLEPGVHLQRVGGHRHGVLPACAQQLREDDGDGGLADAGGPEQGDDLRRLRSRVAHRRKYRPLE